MQVVNVAPPAGAWIETYDYLNIQADLTSRPLRARGLKLFTIPYQIKQYKVAPPAGAWIETMVNLVSYKLMDVAPPAGAWIETL